MHHRNLPESQELCANAVQPAKPPPALHKRKPEAWVGRRLRGLIEAVSRDGYEAEHSEGFKLWRVWERERFLIGRLGGSALKDLGTNRGCVVQTSLTVSGEPDKPLSFKRSLLPFSPFTSTSNKRTVTIPTRVGTQGSMTMKPPP